MKPLVLAPILIQSILAGMGCALAIRARRSITLRGYFAFVVLATITGIPAYTYLAPEPYRLGFFAVTIAHNSLLLALAVEIVSELAPRRLAVPWCVFWCSLLTIGAIRQTANLGNLSLLNLTAAADFCVCGVLILPLLRSDTHWTRENSLTAVGVALVALGSVLPEIKLLHEQETFKVAMQWLDLPGLLALTVGAGWTSADKPQAHAMAA
jgi:hypothetical protein